LGARTGRGRTAWLVTFVTHNSRVSERMVRFGVTDEAGKGPKPLVLTPEEQVFVAGVLLEVARSQAMALLGMNVLPDHVHLVLLARDDEDLSMQVRRLKGRSARELARRRGLAKGAHVWGQKFNRKVITDEGMLSGALRYVENNHLKHVERWGGTLTETWREGILPLVRTLPGTTWLEEARG